MLRPGGRIAFLTIQPTPGLERSKRRRANQVGPPAVALPTSYPSLLRSAGFVAITATDVTADYRATQQRWMLTTDCHADAIREAVGHDAFDERATTRQQTLDAIDAGLLSRFRYVAERPG